MGLADGDLYVSGSILSYQQIIRIYTNFRGASVPSALQAGALWSKSTDSTLWHQGTTLDEVFTEKTKLTWENLLWNAGFGFWPQSTANKGRATITYDAGAKGAGAAPSVGDAVVGGTSGATAYVISYTIASGAFATNDAAGVVTVGSVSHDFAFVDNETITFGGVETAVVNMPDSAIQVGLIQNGGFAAATTGWTPTNCTVASVAGGQVGNCLEITRTGAVAQWVYGTVFTTEVGKTYKVSVYVKSGTSGDEAFKIDVYNAGGSFTKTGTSSGAWVKYTITFEAAYTSYRVYLFKDTATAGTMLFDEATCYETTPCNVANSATAFYGATKDVTLDLYQQHSDGGTLTKDGEFYSLMFVPTSAGDALYLTEGNHAKEEFYSRFLGQTVAIGCWVKTSTASHAYLRLYDTAYTSSGFHTGGGDWEWLEVSTTVDVAATEFEPFLSSAIAPNVDGSTIIYFSQPIMILGSYIGEGNYSRKPGETMWTDNAYVLSNLLAGGTFSPGDDQTINLEADTDGMFPKGAKRVWVIIEGEDSAVGDLIGTRLVRESGHQGVWLNPAVNDLRMRQVGWIDLDANGDFYFDCLASGVGTLANLTLYYKGVQMK